MDTSIEKTSFINVYDSFFSKVTDDMYMELTEEETYSMIQELLIAAIYWFEFPRQCLTDYSKEDAEFYVELTGEEINILAIYMVVEWLGVQIANVQLVRQQYTGSDFKMTSQASHLDKLLTLKENYQNKGFKLQRLYKRRIKGENGIMLSNMGALMGGE